MTTLPKILIVEDEDVLAENLKIFLGRRYPDVRIAPDAEQALTMLNSFEPDIVVMDLVLPGIDGFHAYTEILQRSRRNVGCVMITGHPTETLAERASAQGIRHVLCKPFPMIELQELVDQTTEENLDGMSIPVQAKTPPAPPGAGQRGSPFMRQAFEFLFAYVPVPVT